MGNAFLLSFIVTLVVVPVIAARDPDPRRGLRRALAALLAYGVAYALAVAFLFSKYYVPEAW